MRSALPLVYQKRPDRTCQRHRSYHRISWLEKLFGSADVVRVTLIAGAVMIGVLTLSVLGGYDATPNLQALIGVAVVHPAAIWLLLWRGLRRLAAAAPLVVLGTPCFSKSAHRPKAAAAHAGLQPEA